jgi:hypothetical protein
MSPDLAREGSRDRNAHAAGLRSDAQPDDPDAEDRRGFVAVRGLEPYAHFLPASNELGRNAILDVEEPRLGVFAIAGVRVAPDPMSLGT